MQVEVLLNAGAGTNAGSATNGPDAIHQALASAGISMALFADVDPNPVEKNVHDGVEAFRESKAQIIVAVGGGSPLDVGKIIRLKARPGVHERPLVEYDDATGGDAVAHRAGGPECTEALSRF